MSDNKTKESLGTVARVITLLRVMAESQNALTLTAVAERMNLAPSTTHRLLSFLIAEGLVGRDPRTKTYFCASEFVRLSSLVLHSSSPIDLAAPFMESLVAQFNESILLCLYLEKQKRYAIVKVLHGTHLLRYDILENKSLSLMRGGTARAILAFLPEEEIAEVLTQEAAAAVPGESTDDVLADLELTRQRGYSFSTGQRIPGSVGLGAPIYNATGKVLGSLCITIPQNRFEAKQKAAIGQSLVDHARRLSFSLGYMPAE